MKLPSGSVIRNSMSWKPPSTTSNIKPGSNQNQTNGIDDRKMVNDISTTKENYQNHSLIFVPDWARSKKQSCAPVSIETIYD